ncbi:MAG: monovalent cation/H+ antiporter complex subunit F [Planctomycetota bacterium]
MSLLLLPMLAVLAPIVSERDPWHVALIDILLEVGFVVITISIVLCIIRLVRGPHLADRAVASDAVAVQLAGLVVLFTLKVDALVLFDGVLVLSLIGFAGTVAVAQFIIRRAVRRRDDGGGEVAE